MDRFNDPGDAEGSIIGDGEAVVGGAVIDLSRALVLDHVTVASVNQDDNPVTGKAYALALGGELLATEERREMMVLLTSHSVATLITELSRVTTKEHDEMFLAAFLTGLWDE